jgi:hypothetical protein
MSTALDTAFEAIVSGGEAEEHHGVCGLCYPGEIIPAGSVAICGHRFETTEAVLDCTGLHKCASCLALDKPPFLPCGHPW